MIGLVRWYDPVSRSGRLATPEGKSFSFTLPESAGDLHGGDLVAFELTPANGDRAVDVHVTQSGADYLNDQQRELVNEFHSLVTIQR